MYLSEYVTKPSIEIKGAVAKGYGTYCRPWLKQLLSTAGLDVYYERSQGDYLWCKRNDREEKILDIAGGFGSTLFGHNHSQLTNKALSLLKQDVPIMAQGSCRINASKLARELCRLVGDDYVTIFTNSGTETVEAALKHARLENNRSMFWAIRGSFHGKTLGAIQLTSSYRDPFLNWGPNVRFLDPETPQDWECALKETSSQVAAIIVEPIQGEGGVRPLPDDLIQWLNYQSKTLGIPLITDEIQTGMGRTGAFLASSALGIEPDYICLSKALGGGIAKIGALMIKRKRLVRDFPVIHTSTFAEDDFSCGIALKALELIENDEIFMRCRNIGKKLLKKLRKLQSQFPEQIYEVRGQGLMIGLELINQPASPSNIIKMISQNNYLGLIAAGYLLNIHNIRILPTLNQSTTLRIQPSTYINEKEIDRLVNALEMFCQAVYYSDAGHLTGYQVGQQSNIPVDWRKSQPSKQQTPTTKSQVAFIGHFLVAEDVIHCDPSISDFPKPILDKYVTRTSPVVDAFVTDCLNIKSTTGQEVHLNCIGLNLTAMQISQARKRGQLRWIREKIEAAAHKARDLGCQVVAFGGYTSSVTGNCRRIKTDKIALTSGNSLTVGMALKALTETAVNVGIGIDNVPIAVVGVPGNIASVAAILLAKNASELTLVQSTSASSKVISLKEKINRERPGVKIKITDDLKALRNAALIITATVAGKNLIKAEHISEHKTIICDVAVPHDVSNEVLEKRPNAIILDGGIVRLPCNDDFSVPGIPLQNGRVYSCMAEPLLMGLEGFTENGTCGDITVNGVELMLRLAEKHGFTLDVVRRWAKKEPVDH